MEQTFNELSSILTIKTLQLNRYIYKFEKTPQQHLQKFLVALMNKKDVQSQGEIYSRFINYMSDQRHCKLSTQFFGDLSDIRVISCNQSRAYTFEGESRAYCLYGRAVSALRRKVKEGQTERQYLCSQLENAIFQLFQEGNFHIPKNESHEIEDVLLNFSSPDDSLDPIILSNEVFSPFIPQSYALVLILPIPLPRPDHTINFLKGTLLHVYMEQCHILHKIAIREVFYKNTIVKGIYFIEQGQVESTGGRIIARGWVTNGKCKSEGYGWKFKVMPFIKSIAKNQHIWKQFVNDLNLNKEYPFNLSYLLNLQQDLDLYEAPDKRGRRGVKLPRIVHRSFDFGKLTQIERMKHYDDRINEICDYKQKLMTKKSGGGLNRNITQIGDSIGDRSQRIIQLRSKSKSKQMFRYPSNNLSSSNENILIMSVLRKLEGLTEPRGNYNDDTKQRKDKIKISPAKLNEKSRIMKKRRYNQ